MLLARLGLLWLSCWSLMKDITPRPGAALTWAEQLSLVPWEPRRQRPPAALLGGSGRTAACSGFGDPSLQYSSGTRRRQARSSWKLGNRCGKIKLEKVVLRF